MERMNGMILCDTLLNVVDQLLSGDHEAGDVLVDDHNSKSRSAHELAQFPPLVTVSYDTLLFLTG